jgi:hypothetical protein
LAIDKSSKQMSCSPRGSIHIRQFSISRLQQLVAAFACGFCLPLLLYSLGTSVVVTSSDSVDESFPSLDGCYHVYLDVGSNVGIQVRKLYQPELFPRSKIFKTYDQLFGEPR